MEPRNGNNRNEGGGWIQSQNQTDAKENKIGQREMCLETI